MEARLQLQCAKMEFRSNIRRKEQAGRLVLSAQASQKQKRTSAARTLDFDGVTSTAKHLREQPNMLRANNFYRSSDSRPVRDLHRGNMHVNFSRPIITVTGNQERLSR